MNHARAVRILWIGPTRPAQPLLAALHDHGYVILQLEPGPQLPASCRRLRHDALVLACATGDAPACIATVRALRKIDGDGVAMIVLLPQLAPIDEVLLLGAGADAVADPAQGSLVPLARLRRCIGRAAAASSRATRATTLGPLEVDSPRCRVRLDGRTLSLRASAVRLVDELAARDGQPVARSDLALRLGQAGFDDGSRTVDMAICRLRQALRAQDVRGIAIESVRGRGYRLVLQQAARPA